jgi:DNA-binding transcriptional MerR regulator
MPKSLHGEKYYRTSEACSMVGISRITFLRWVREGLFTDVEHRDWKGWRLFTDDDLVRLETYVSLAKSSSQYLKG